MSEKKNQEKLNKAIEEKSSPTPKFVTEKRFNLFEKRVKSSFEELLIVDEEIKKELDENSNLDESQKTALGYIRRLVSFNTRNTQLLASRVNKLESLLSGEYVICRVVEGQPLFPVFRGTKEECENSKLNPSYNYVLSPILSLVDELIESEESEEKEGE